SKAAVSARRPLPTLNATFPPAPHYASNVARHIWCGKAARRDLCVGPRYPGSLPRPITLPGGHPLLQIGTRSLDSDHNQLINHRSLATEQQRCPRFGMGSYTFAPASFRASLTGLPFLLPEGSTRWPLRPDGPDGSRFLPAAMIAPALTPLSARWCCVRDNSTGRSRACSTARTACWATIRRQFRCGRNTPTR